MGKVICSLLQLLGEENSNDEGEVHSEKDLPDQNASALKELEEEDGYGERTSVTLTFKDDAELSSLQSALLQLLQQVSLYSIPVMFRIYLNTRESLD